MKNNLIGGYRWGEYTFLSDNDTLRFIEGFTANLDPDYDLDYLIARLIDDKYYIGISPDYCISVAKDWCLIW